MCAVLIAAVPLKIEEKLIDIQTEDHSRIKAIRVGSVGKMTNARGYSHIATSLMEASISVLLNKRLKLKISR